MLKFNKSKISLGEMLNTHISLTAFLLLHAVVHADYCYNITEYHEYRAVFSAKP